MNVKRGSESGERRNRNKSEKQFECVFVEPTVEVRENVDKKLKKLFLLKVQVLICCVHKSSGSRDRYVTLQRFFGGDEQDSKLFLVTSKFQRVHE